MRAVHSINEHRDAQNGLYKDMGCYSFMIHSNTSFLKVEINRELTQEITAILRAVSRTISESMDVCKDSTEGNVTS